MAKTISGPVGDGPRARNLPGDVSTIQQLLNDIKAGDGGADPKLTVDGKCGSKTRAAIQKFQLHHFGWKLADGRVDPSGPTLIRMNECAGGLPAWHKSTVFKMRRNISDGVPSPPEITEFFLVQDGQTFRRAIYAFVPRPIPVAIHVTPNMMHYEGSWTDMRTPSALAVYELEGPATLVGTTGQPGSSSSLSVMQPMGITSAKLPFPVSTPKSGVFQFVAMLET